MGTGTRAAWAALVISSVALVGTVWARAQALDTAVPAFGPIGPWVAMWQGLARAYTLALVAAGGVWLLALGALARRYGGRLPWGLAGGRRPARKGRAGSAGRSVAG